MNVKVIFSQFWSSTIPPYNMLLSWKKMLEEINNNYCEYLNLTTIRKLTTKKGK